MVEYDPHQWRTSFFAVRGSMLRPITVRALLVTMAAVLAAITHEFIVSLTWSEVAATAYGLVGTSLGLLLVFRTNASYDRWWEGRKLWGTLVNTSRNLARSSLVHLRGDPERLTRILELVTAFPYAAMHELRGIRLVPDKLHPQDQAAVAGAKHLPTAISTRITYHLNEARRAGVLTDMVFVTLDANCQTQIDVIGACERIHKTPLPFAYVVHLRRALVMYCGALPFAFVSRFGWATALVTFMVAYILLGIEAIGVEIEDPFGGDENDLPLDRICENIEKSVMSLKVDTSQDGTG